MTELHADARHTALEERLGHYFANRSLLADALTHPSLALHRGHRKGEAAAASPFERLEFLGDRVVGLAVADLLMRRFPDEPEGDLSRRFTALVCQDTMAEIAAQIGLPGAIRLCDGTVKDNGRANPSILSDACEAVIGAVFADAGFEVARSLVERLWADRIAAAAEPPRDAKTALQEWAQGRGLPLPKYTVLAQEGPSHAPTFRIRVTVAETGETEAEGSSKRAAEQAAATALLARIAGKTQA